MQPQTIKQIPLKLMKTPITLKSKSSESGHPSLVPDFRGNAFNFSPLRVMLAVGLSYIAFIMLRYVHCGFDLHFSDNE